MELHTTGSMDEAVVTLPAPREGMETVSWPTSDDPFTKAHK